MNKGESRAEMLLHLQQIATALGVNDPEVQKVYWVTERQLALLALRDVCAEYGDNSWDDSLNLSDVINKHLLRYLDEQQEWLPDLIRRRLIMQLIEDSRWWEDTPAWPANIRGLLEEYMPKESKEKD